MGIDSIVALFIRAIAASGQLVHLTAITSSSPSRCQHGGAPTVGNGTGNTHCSQAQFYRSALSVGKESAAAAATSCDGGGGGVEEDSNGLEQPPQDEGKAQTPGLKLYQIKVSCFPRSPLALCLLAA